MSESAYRAKLELSPRDSGYLNRAKRAYLDDRYSEALNWLKKISCETLEVIELKALTLYRMSRYKQALNVLVSLRESWNYFDQMPVEADCLRALGRLNEAIEIYKMLAKKGVSKEVLSEARIVAAKALSELGKLKEAIELMEPTKRYLTNPKYYHLRQWYVLADLYEQAGDFAQARALFKRVAEFDSTLADAKYRARGLG
jgi:tetratricopeptide (TPR) repeat protein